jgi:SWI/SNF-related matrix-associated actin-dependent regulator of chromatin subfamily A member 5
MYLKHNLGITGPHLIVIPQLTIQNWSQVQPMDSRCQHRHPYWHNWGTRRYYCELTHPQDFKVCITGYEICLIEKPTVKQFSIELYYH